MPDKIHLILHLGEKLDHLLIVMHRENQGWLFRLVDSEGKILQEQTGFKQAIAAEEQGKQWLSEYLYSL
ncbi:hypothetical protein [Gloeocapsa sp. PCC 73106]|uniref:hypothetical protein n=1 Tax=Gloeocapsa sp. PCC 73106 TaxID=102232 RepID=UPI0002ABCF3F|nr:hypothetical protein [Gloeocapsa sp. PCC 73106]ELR99219.1 hypothetical protein GLO73106DRAFT_00030690 [Gloeocapsa sp. PCC 73106]